MTEIVLVQVRGLSGEIVVNGVMAGHKVENENVSMVSPVSLVALPLLMKPEFAISGPVHFTLLGSHQSALLPAEVDSRPNQGLVPILQKA